MMIFFSSCHWPFLTTLSEESISFKLKGQWTHVHLLSSTDFLLNHTGDYLALWSHPYVLEPAHWLTTLTSLAWATLPPLATGLSINGKTLVRKLIPRTSANTLLPMRDQLHLRKQQEEPVSSQVTPVHVMAADNNIAAGKVPQWNTCLPTICYWWFIMKWDREKNPKPPCQSQSSFISNLNEHYVHRCDVTHLCPVALKLAAENSSPVSWVVRCRRLRGNLRGL